MAELQSRRGPWTHRVLILALSALLTVLFIWFLGFVLRDLDRMPYPDREAIAGRHIPAELSARSKELQKRKEEVRSEIQGQTETQTLLQRSMENSRQTMNQLLEMNKLQLQKNVVPSEAEQQAMADAQRAFLTNQARFEEANQAIARLTDEDRRLESDLAKIREETEEIWRTKVNPEIAVLDRHRALTVASIKLAILIPLLALAAGALWKRRSSAWAPIYWSAFLAIFYKTGSDIHEYFPSAIFKYIALGAAIVVVFLFLSKLIRMMLAPKPEWLLKQYREAYQRSVCPNCAFPIRRGPLRHWDGSRSKSRLALLVPASGAEQPKEEPYSCPSCGTSLFAPCLKCAAISPTLLPFCESCGAPQEIR